MVLQVAGARAEPFPVLLVAGAVGHVLQAAQHRAGARGESLCGAAGWRWSAAGRCWQ